MAKRESSEERNKQLVRQFVEAVNTGNHALLDDVLAPDFVRHSQATPDVNVRSREDFKRFDEGSRAIFPDQQVTLTSLVAEGDRVAFYGSYRGTQQGPMDPFPPTGKKMDIDISGVFRIAQGRLAELWITWDNVAGLAQLGHFPPAG